MNASNRVFNVNGAIDKDGELICKQTLTSVILEVVNKLGIYSLRDLSNVSLANITEIENPKLVENNMTILFRAGIVYCEIIAHFDKKEMLLNNTLFGVRY